MQFFYTPSLLFILLYVGAYPLVTAQNTAQGFRPYSYNNTNYTLYLGVALAISIIIILGICLILKFYCKPQPQPRPRTRLMPNNQASKGLDPSILERFPIFRYSRITGHSSGIGHIECSVCLSPFETDEMLRSLPKCNHVFHVSCLDPWLRDHTTCPLCRMNLVLAPSELANAEMVRVDQGLGSRVREDVTNHGALEVSPGWDIEEGQSVKYKRWNSMGHTVEANGNKGFGDGDGEIIGKFKRSNSYV